MTPTEGSEFGFEAFVGGRGGDFRFIDKRQNERCGVMEEKKKTHLYLNCLNSSSGGYMAKINVKRVEWSLLYFYSYMMVQQLCSFFKILGKNFLAAASMSVVWSSWGWCCWL